MAASLADIDAALYEALAALQATGTAGPTEDAPFALVGRYAGPPTPKGFASICAQYPAALLCWDGETGARDVDTAGPDSEDRGAGAWTVYVVLEDPRAVDDAVQGASGVPGALPLIDAVLGACNALLVDGLWRGRAVRYVRAGNVPSCTSLGVAYAYAVAFEALRVVPDAPDPDVGAVDLTDVRGNVNQQVPAGGDAATNPFDVFDADTT